MAVSDYSTTAGDNTSISGITVSDATVADQLDNIIRQMMADTKAFYDAALLLAGGTMTGNLTIDNASAAVVTLDGGNGSASTVYQNAGVTRWGTYRDSATGDFAMARYDASGVYQATTLKLTTSGAVETEGVARFGHSNTTSPVVSGGSDGTTITGGGSIQSYDADGAALFAGRSDDGNVALFYRGRSNNVGGISVTAAATAFNTSSDYRLKTVTGDVDDAVERVMAVPVRRGYFNAAPETPWDFFLAHELATVAPNAVTGEKDAVDDAGAIVPQVVDYSKLVPVLWAAVQELSARVAALEA